MSDARWLGIFALAFITALTTKECSGQSESLLRVGKAINVFIRYGYLSISMKVISYNDTERWIFKEPTRNVFQVSEMLFICKKHALVELHAIIVNVAMRLRLRSRSVNDL